VLTLLPSLYFGYDIVQQNRFLNNADRFIKNEAVFPNDYLLNKSVDPKKRSIVLIFGGKKIEPADIESRRNKLEQYDLKGVHFEIKQGFAYLEEQKSDEQENSLRGVLAARSAELDSLHARLDSVQYRSNLSRQVFQELKIQYPQIAQAVIEPAAQVYGGPASAPAPAFIFLKMNKTMSAQDKKQLEAWLKVRLQNESLTLVIN